MGKINIKLLRAAGKRRIERTLHDSWFCVRELNSLFILSRFLLKIKLVKLLLDFEKSSDSKVQIFKFTSLDPLITEQLSAVKLSALIRSLFITQVYKTSLPKNVLYVIPFLNSNYPAYFKKAIHFNASH